MPISFIPMSYLDAEGRAHGLEGRLRFAENLLPCYGSWRSWPQQTFYSATINEQVYGSYVHAFPSGMGGSSYIGDAATEFHGTKTKLYTFDPSVPSWTDLSRGGGYSTLGKIPAAWRFASWGIDVYACNAVDIFQRRTNNAGNFANGPVSTFTPVPRFIAPVREFMVAASLNQAGRYPDEIAWSDIDDPTWWDPADATRTDSLAGSKVIRSRPGQITGFVGGEYGVIWKRRSMYGLQFTGGSDIFRLDELSRSVGTPWPGSIVPASDGFTYFMGPDGFYRQAGLGAPEKLRGPFSLLLEYDLFAKEPLSQNLPTEMWREDLRVVGGESPETGIIIWFYRSKANLLEGRCIRGIALDTATLRWSMLDCPGENYTTLARRSTNFEEASFMWGVLGCSWDGAITKRWKWYSTTGHAAALGTHRFALSFGEEGNAGAVRITGACPIVATLEDGAAVTTDHRAVALPADAAVNVSAANSPIFEPQLDALGAVISPRHEAPPASDADDFNFFPVRVEGHWFTADLTLPAGHVAVRGIPGIYLRWESI